MHGVQAIENAAPATIGPPLPARAISASTCHSRFSRSMNVAATNSTPMTISNTAPMFVSRSWLSRSVSPSAVAVSPRRMKTTENEAMKSRLGPSTLRQSVSSISSMRTPVTTER